MTNEQSEINRIFEQFSLIENSYFSKEHLEDITAEYSSEAIVRAEKIFREAINVPVDWRAATIDSALPVLRDFLRREYPWLSDKSRSNINYAFVMSWK